MPQGFLPSLPVPKDPETVWLHNSFRSFLPYMAYMAANDRAFVQSVLTYDRCESTSIRHLVQHDAHLARLYNRAIDAVIAFRRRHNGLIQHYILSFTEEPEIVYGTGGVHDLCQLMDEQIKTTKSCKLAI